MTRVDSKSLRVSRPPGLCWRVTKIDRKAKTVTFESCPTPSRSRKKRLQPIGRMWLPELQEWCYQYPPMVLPDGSLSLRGER
jgi:hypothetical protein